MATLFYLLFFFVPIVLYPYSYELFEFNKMVLVYILTVLIVGSWTVRMIGEKKIIFRRTIFDIPLLLYLASQLLSLLTSVDLRTSLLGYYSRFHGGFFSTLSYALLFWAFVANMDRGKTLKAIRFLLYSGVLVSIYGVLQHFGIDKDVWVQDVASRVFSTLGQPNWLAAWLTALLPISWALALNVKLKTNNSKPFWAWTLLSALFFLTILYTKSRSGLLGFGVAFGVFWIGTYGILKKPFLVISFSLLVITLFTGTPWTPRPIAETPKPVGPALEVGGTESGEIRKIVWKGAIDIWKHYPITGSGPETFAFSYYQFRPAEHNLVSEWDFLYNKAHNELLNIAANTGTLGLVSYLYFIGIVIIYFVKRLKDAPDLFQSAFLAGFSSIFVTNFFGFSVVPIALLFFLYPGMAVALDSSDKTKVTSYKPLGLASSAYKKSGLGQKIGLSLVLLITFYLLLSISKYWYADLLFAKGKALNDSHDYVNARSELTGAIRLSPREAIFWDELSQSDVSIALLLAETKESEKANEFAGVAIEESKKAILLSPRNINLKRNRASLFIKLASIDPSYLNQARDTLLDAVTHAPTEAKLFYNLGLTYARLGDSDNALKVFEKTISMKKNYKDARLAYALVLIDKGQKLRAKEELNYILKNIDPNDPITRQTLEEIK